MRSTLLIACVLSTVPVANSQEPGSNGEALPAAVSISGRDAGDVRDDNGLKMRLVWCPPGAVVMGDGVMGDAEGPPVRAVLTRGYWMGRYEITQAEWKSVMETEPWKELGRVRLGDDVAATYVSWEDAMSFCARLTARERKGGGLPADWQYTLPTEAQWEYACRAKTTTLFHFGDDAARLDEYAWYSQRTPALRAAAKAGEPLRVGGKKANPWGLHDMHGNVWEWCRDAYTVRLPLGRNPETTTGESYRVIRGGSWWNGPLDCRSGRRDRHVPDHRDYSLGFRVTLTSIPAEKPDASR